MTKEERIANIVADLEGWKIKSDDSGSYLEVECGEFLLEMDLCDIPSIETLTKEELAANNVKLNSGFDCYESSPPFKPSKNRIRNY